MLPGVASPKAAERIDGRLIPAMPAMSSSRPRRVSPQRGGRPARAHSSGALWPRRGTQLAGRAEPAPCPRARPSEDGSGIGTMPSNQRW